MKMAYTAGCGGSTSEGTVQCSVADSVTGQFAPHVGSGFFTDLYPRDRAGDALFIMWGGWDRDYRIYPVGKLS